MAERNAARLAAGLALGALLSLSSSAAHADERTEARGHFKKGMGAIAEGHYDAGIEELKQAYDILPHPNVLYNIARAYVDMGDLENAVVYYRKYLEGAPPDRDEVAQIVASLEARIRKQQAMLFEAEQTQTGGGPQAPGGPGPGAVPKPGAAVGPGAPGAAVPGGPAAPGGPVAPGERGQEGSLKTEEVFEETVVTASKTAQSPLDAPNSTSIITAQDIRLSGITKIPELLRRLAGVDIMEVTGGQAEVSLRGFNQRLSNKVLVLVDGRSVYADLIGATLWTSLPVAVEEIDRIEVVRGPGSALYGADAFNGVVNIISKAPGTGGSGLNAGYGTNNNAHGTVWVNGRDKEISYRLAGGYEIVPRWTREVAPGRVDLRLFTADQDASARTFRIDGEVRRQFGKDVTVGVAGAYGQGLLEILAVGPINDQVLNANTGQGAAFVKTKNVELRVFWNHTDGVNS
ncbi:MAG TPA: TonB-dependent receptor plug domain-containing protein, partial [Myxococcales bacterium]|nr:TonB-dependent receptor plug domain-containing protein [Myxococcales bacterium]